jgi:hypothetical protein
MRRKKLRSIAREKWDDHKFETFSMIFTLSHPFPHKKGPTQIEGKYPVLFIAINLSYEER